MYAHFLVVVAVAVNRNNAAGSEREGHESHLEKEEGSPRGDCNNITATAASTTSTTSTATSTTTATAPAAISNITNESKQRNNEYHNPREMDDIQGNESAPYFFLTLLFFFDFSD
jgi:hypothetical protein